MKKIYILAILLLSVVIGVRAEKSVASAKVLRTITTDDYGQLKENLEADYLEIDSLIVAGPIDESDFATMRELVFNGKLRGINLFSARAKDDKIPDGAFIGDGIETTPGYFGFSCKEPLKLEWITLPENLCEIGSEAFLFARIKNIELSLTLRKLGDWAFASCVEMQGNPLIIPEGVEEIPANCFYLAAQIQRIVLPSTVKAIRSGAFMEAYRLEEVEMQPGLETIEDDVFCRCFNLQSLILPNTVTEFGNYNFFNTQVEEIVFSNGMTDLDFITGLHGFTLKRLVLPDKLERMGDQFEYLAGLEELVLPETLQYILGSFRSINDMQKLYCRAAVPPILAVDAFTTLPADITLYVPTGSAESYRMTPGWKNFPNIVELTEMPTVGMESVTSRGDAVKVYATTDGVRIEGAEDRMYEIYSLDGMCMKSGRCETVVTEISIPKGLYFVKVGEKAVSVII